MINSLLDCHGAAAEASLTPSRLKDLSDIARATAELGGSVLMQHYGRLESIEQKSRSGVGAPQNIRVKPGKRSTKKFKDLSNTYVT